MVSTLHAAPADERAVAWGTARARWILLATVLGSGLTMLDATVVNVAAPALGADLGASLGQVQWVLNGYTLALAALILLGGSLGDRFGRRRVFVIGVVWFGIGSLLCGLAPSIGWLIAARGLQGVGGALLVPGSLAIISTTFAEADRPRAIGAWSGLGGVAAAVGPLLGGWLVETTGWRWVFLINPPIAAVVVVVTLRHVPEVVAPSAPQRFDVVGALLAAIGLAGLSYALINAGHGLDARVLLTGAIGVGGLIAFVLVERRQRSPMLPMGLFASRQFSAVNLVTFLMYAALGALLFLVVVGLQIVAGFGALAAGSALLPITALMLTLSAASGRLAGQIGPRWQMAVGPLIAAGGTLLIAVRPDSSLLLNVLPGLAVIGLGLACTVAPLTSVALSSVDAGHAGVASGVNNAVARSAGLLAVAGIPVLAGLTGDAASHPDVFAAGLHRATLICAGLFAAAGLLSLALIRNPTPSAPPAPTPAPPRRASAGSIHCGVGAPPLGR